MKKLIFLSLALYLIGFVSCSQEHSHDNESSEHSHIEADEHDHDHSEEHAHDHDEAMVHLNEGQKWEANAETTEGIENMTTIVSQFNASEGEKDYAELKTSLESEFQMIFQKCTMTGEAHEQLHNYLLPMKYMFAALDSEDQGLKEEKASELQAHLAEYSNYFE